MQMINHQLINVFNKLRELHTTLLIYKTGIKVLKRTLQMQWPECNLFPRYMMKQISLKMLKHTHFKKEKMKCLYLSIMIFKQQINGNIVYTLKRIWFAMIKNGIQIYIFGLMKAIVTRKIKKTLSTRNCNYQDILNN